MGVNKLLFFNLFNDGFDPMNEILSLQILEELVDHPLVMLNCKLLHSCLKQEVLG